MVSYCDKYLLFTLDKPVDQLVGQLQMQGFTGEICLPRVSVLPVALNLASKVFHTKKQQHAYACMHNDFAIPFDC